MPPSGSASCSPTPASSSTPSPSCCSSLAARADLVSRVIRPALEAGRDVVADRFADSSVAYQGAARGLGMSHVLSLTDTVIDGLWPDLTVLLRVDPEVGLGRAGGEDRFESEGLELQRAVADGLRGDSQDRLRPGRRHRRRRHVEEVHGRVMEAAACIAKPLLECHRAPAARSGRARRCA